MAMIFFVMFSVSVAVWRSDASWAGEAIMGAFASICGVLGIHRWAGVRDFENVTSNGVDDEKAS